MGTTSIGGREESGYDWKRCPPERFSYFPISYSNRDPEKGKINRQSSSSSILLLVYCSWFKTDMYTEEGSTTRGGTDIISIFKLLPFSIFLFFFSVSAQRREKQIKMKRNIGKQNEKFLGFCFVAKYYLTNSHREE